MAQTHFKTSMQLTKSVLQYTFRNFGEDIANESVIWRIWMKHFSRKMNDVLKKCWHRWDYELYLFLIGLNAWQIRSDGSFQVEFLENDLEDQYLLAELDELDFISRNFERRRQNAATVIQRFWRRRKKLKT